MVKNLTEGKPLPLLFFFALPMVAGNLFQRSEERRVGERV